MAHSILCPCSDCMRASVGPFVVESDYIKSGITYTTSTVTTGDTYIYTPSSTTPDTITGITVSSVPFKIPLTYQSVSPSLGKRPKLSRVRQMVQRLVAKMVARAAKKAAPDGLLWTLTEMAIEEAKKAERARLRTILEKLRRERSFYSDVYVPLDEVLDRLQ